MTDIKRLSDLLADYAGHITHRSLQRVSPLSVPLLLEVGRESVTASAVDELLSELENELISEAFHNIPQKQLL